MKEIIAIIRPKKVEATKEALEKLGFPCLTALAVLGRGHQRGIAAELNISLRSDLLSRGKTTAGLKYIPKRMLTIIVSDTDVDSVVQKIVEVNQTAQIGDGKIFICPVENALRVRTGEEGESAVV